LSKYLAAAAAIGVVGAGAALVETALIPGLLIGGAAVLAPRYLPKLLRRPKPSKVRRQAKPAAAPKTSWAVLPRVVVERSLAKTVTYRIVITAMDFSWNYVVLGEAAAAAGLSTVSLVVGPVFYFLHETAWHSFGPSAMRKMGLWKVAVHPDDGAGDAKAPPEGGRFAIDLAMAKTITFRTFATVTEFATNYAVVREPATAAALTAFGFVFGPFIYLGHEKAWDYFDPPKEGGRLGGPAASDVAEAGAAARSTPRRVAEQETEPN
jgi:uncharacterized membrane protein